jgi:hypothetical protein
LELIQRKAEKNGETAGDVDKEARDLGINLDVTNAFKTPEGGVNVIGPDPDLDNPWSACPPVFLHGFLSGTIMMHILFYCHHATHHHHQHQHHHHHHHHHHHRHYYIFIQAR